MPSFTRSGASLLVAIQLAIGSIALGQTEPSDLPTYVEGIDLTLPAQEAFAGWPTDEVRGRTHGLPWSAGAFRRAALFARPVALVMTVNWSKASTEWMNTTLSDPEVSRVLNDSYVTVVVNADLMPELRERYGVGSWPLVALLTPTGYPLVTQVQQYPEGSAPIWSSAIDRDTLLFMLREGAVYWKRQAKALMRVGPEWSAASAPADPVAGAATLDAAETVGTWLMGNADVEDGGFGLAPKFVPPSLEPLAAIRAARGDAGLTAHSRFTLERLVASPLYDRSAGGVYRLATEPSFGGVKREKLLEDNVELIRQIVSSLRREPSDDLRRALEKTVDFVTRDLARDGGGFYHAIPAPGSDGRAAAVDRLVLSGSNADAGATLLRAGMLTGDEAVIGQARAAIDLVYREGLQSGQGVRHAIEPRVPTAAPYLDTLATVALAFTDAYETTGDSRLLGAARTLVDGARSELSDPTSAGLRDRLPERRPLGLLSVVRRPLRGNVRLARAMIRLEWHEIGSGYRAEALTLLSGFSGGATRYGVHAAELALAIEEARGTPLRIEINGSSDDGTTQALRRAAVNTAWPFTVVTTGAVQGVPSAVVERGDSRRNVTRVAELVEAVRAATGGE